MATKIFISSVSKGLEDIRLQVGDFIRNLGHNPIIFEDKAFAKNQADLMLTTCIKEVEDSQIYVLIIGREVGYIVPAQNKSVTHLELRKAIASNKTIYVFVEQYIKELYFNEYLRIFKELRDKEPHRTQGTAPSLDEVMRKLKVSIDKRVFDILNDAYQVVPWIYGFQNAEEIVQTLKSELSATLASHIDLKNKKQIQSIEYVITAADRFKQYNIFLDDFFPLLNGIIPINDKDEMLRKVQSNLKGGMIYYDEGLEITSKFLKVGNSDGTSLYKYDGVDKLDLQARSGLASARRNLILVSDQDSYVAATFRDALAAGQQGQKLSSSEIFITDRQIYLCHVFGDYVFTVHFPIDELHVDVSQIDDNAHVLYEGLLNLKANNDIIRLISYCLS